MAELLDRIDKELQARLAELRPLVDEHRRLEQALRALGDASTSSPAADGAAPVKPKARRQRTHTAPAAARKRAPRGANRAALLAAVLERPGATSGELATASGIQRNTLNTLLARLVNDGELETRDLPTGRRGYALKPVAPTVAGDRPATV